MPRLTPEQLQAARKHKAQQQAEAEQNKQEQLELAERALRQQQEELDQRKAHHHEVFAQQIKVASVIDAHYNEIDKLAKKAPREPVSQMTVEMINRAITSFTSLLAEAHDEFADQITTFVPAGDMPETRDVLLLLAQMRAALKRFDAALREESSQFAVESDRLRREQMRLVGDDEEDDEEEDPLERALRELRQGSRL